MSSIIKRGTTIQGNMIKLQDIMQTNLFQETEDNQEDREELNSEESSFEYDTLYQQAIEEKERLLAAAKEEAAAILKMAREEASSIEQQAYQQAEKILASAQQQQLECTASAKEEADRIREQALNEKQSLLIQLEPEVVEVIKVLVAHIINEEVLSGNKWISYIVKKMVHKEELTGDLKVHIASCVFNQLTPEEHNMLTSIKETLKVLPDESINETTCVVETIEGSVLYDVSEGLDKVIQDLTKLDRLANEVAYDRV